MDIENETEGVIYSKLLYRIENAKKPLETLNVKQLNALLKALEWTPQEFAEATGVEVPGASVESLGTATLSAPSSGSYEYVGPNNEDHLEQMGARPVTSTMKVPIVGTVSAGRGETTVELEGELEVPEEVLRRYRNYSLFALRVTGDSMYCEDLPVSIPPGAYVVAAAELSPQPGDVVVAWHEPTQTGYLKEWHPRREHQVLRSWNPEVPPILVQPDDEITVQGVVVNVTFDPRRIKRERKKR
ncbi:LexA family protein [Oceanithermus sp.]